MPKFGQSARRRAAVVGLLAAPLAIAGLVFAGTAQGAGGPSMEVLPKTTGLKYSQTVEIKGHHLPKGSGSVAATICGLQDASGKTLSSPGANDCAGANEIGDLVIVKSWQSNGEFDTKYTLPASGRKFGKNSRFCDRSHRCALVVADANPDKPAYYIETKILFSDQTSTTASKPNTTTTEPPTKPTSTTTQYAGNSRVHISMRGSGSSDLEGGGAESSGSVKFGASATVVPPATGAAPSPPPLTAATPDRALANGSGPQQLQVLVQSPSLLCVEGASAWQNNQQISDA